MAMQEQTVVASASKDLELSDFVVGEFVRWYKNEVEHFGIVDEINFGVSNMLAVQGGNPFPTWLFHFTTPEQRARNREVNLRKTTLGEFLADSNRISENYSDYFKKYNEVSDSITVILKHVAGRI